MAERRDSERSPEPEDHAYIRTAVTLGNYEIIKDWLSVEEHQRNKAMVTDLILVPAAMYGQLELIKCALKYGDLSKKDTDLKYPGWSLMHFAVEGAQRVVILSQEGDEVVQVNNEPRETFLMGNVPATVEEVRWKQMDIILHLALAGIPTAMEDASGDTASDRACRRLEEPFIEGAMLLDILTLLNEDYRDQVVDTPGLACIPSNKSWKRSVQQLVEWAYHRRQYDILQFCHSKKYAELDLPSLVLTSVEFGIRRQRRPLLIDSIVSRDFNIVRIILTTPPVKYDILFKNYEYQEGNTSVKRSILTHAVETHFNPTYEGADILPDLLSKDVIGVYLTNICISGVSLRHLPQMLFHPNLQTLDVRDNDLDSFPCEDQCSLGWDCPQLENLNISNNLFVDIPKEIFSLKSLTRFIAAGNKIRGLPLEMWCAPSLKILDLSENMIQVLPCHNPTSRVSMTFSHATFSQPRHNRARVFVNQPLPLDSVKHGYINYEIDSSDNLHRGQVGFALQTLDLSGNQLQEIPRSLPCLAPLLQNLKLAKNHINRLGQAADYPPHLHMLDVSSNGLVSWLSPTVHTPCINCVQSEVTAVTAQCSHLQHENMAYLKFLYCSNNRLEEVEIEYEIDQPERGLEDSAHQQLASEPQTRGPKKLLFPNLQGLQLSNNRLTGLPENISRLGKLCELAFDGNPGINKLPNGLHKLTGLFTLRYVGISDPVVQELANIKTTPEILYYLKARESQAVVNNSMRLFVIGHFSKGKTTLLEALNGQLRRPFMNNFDIRSRRIGANTDTLSAEEKVSTVGIECGKWTCSLKRRHKNEPPISFYTWDFAGQEEYYVTHQCFLTNRALYLLVWNVEDGSPGIESLSIWLQNMQARAQRYSHNVIIVGTHLDKIPKHLREAKKRAWSEEILDRYGKNISRVFPNIAAVAFIGSPPGKNRYLELDTLNDIVYEVAVNMKAPKDFSSSSIGLTINILDEKIPQSYDQLRARIEDIASELRRSNRPPVLERANFYAQVVDIIDSESEVDTAVRFLHTTTGVVLHFDQPLIADYFIVDPQKWFDLCSLVIAPDNVSSLVVNAGRMGDDKYGLLSCRDMNEQFERQGFDANISKLIRTFLSLFHCIHQISKDYCLVPSAISASPTLPRDSERGSFPKRASFMYSVQQRPPLSSLPSVLPIACSSPEEVHLKVSKTGLIYRRFILLPPIASGFWSKLIALFLQKKDFNKLIEGATPAELNLKAMGPAYRLRSLIGNIEFVWSYWKTGIMLYIDECVALRVNSFQSHEFEDPLLQTSVSHSQMYLSRVKQLKQFIYHSSRGLRTFPSSYKEVIEIVAPEIHIETTGQLGDSSASKPLTARILAKALEIVDEVVKSHSEHLCTSGIYSHADMAHIVPCPLCYGDKDQRHTQPLHTLDEDDISTSLTNFAPNPESALGPGFVPREDHRAGLADSTETAHTDVLVPLPPPGTIYVFTVDQLIRETFNSDHVNCPNHGNLEIENLAPDLVFADLVDVKLERSRFSLVIDKDEPPIARGSFGKVYKNSLEIEGEGEIEVAVKIFDHPEHGMSDHSGEIIRSYADMRYELNKLSTLKHPFIVRFIGVLTNPHAFVLEWAPMKSLEHIRAEHAHFRTPICALSIFKTIIQITSALAYLHHKVQIVHQDLRCSNVLVFQFPRPRHACYQRSEFNDCNVSVKLTDMGISANPLVHRVGEANGFKLMVPECLIANAMGTLTEKVDMFCLGSCLYELMTLRGLPPSDISQPEYSVMLQSGKRAQFHAKDPSYPLYLFQTLEDCWQQEHYKRPSAELLCRVLMKLSNVSYQEDHNQCTTRSDGLKPVLLDSYTLHHDKRVARSEMAFVEGQLEMCVALATRDESSTTIATAQYQTEVKTELCLQSCGTIKNNSVTALHRTEQGHVFIACADNTLTMYDPNRVKYVTNPAKSCPGDHIHGEIIKIFYDSPTAILIVGFSGGLIHIEKCTQGIEKSFSNTVQWRVFCDQMETRLELSCVECFVKQEFNGAHRIEVWLGSRLSTIEVWSLHVPKSTTWGREAVEKCREVTHVRVPQVVMEDSASGIVKTMLRVSEDRTKVVVCMQVSGRKSSSMVAIVDAEEKACVRSFNWDQSIASIILTPRKLALGTYNGEVYVYNTVDLLKSDSTLEGALSAKLRAHKPKSKIYSMACVESLISTEGYTRVFPAYIGHCEPEQAKDILVTVGYGREYTTIADAGQTIFKSFARKDGTYINIWLL